MAFGDLTFARNSVKNVLNAAGNFAQVAIDTPAFEFNTDGTYRRFLVEPTRINLFTYSQAFDNAAWTKTSGTITANATTAPDGTMTADKLVDGASTGSITQAQTTTAATHVQSIFAKAGERSEFVISNSVGNVTFDLTTGAVVSETAGTGSSEEYPNGWWKLNFQFSATAGTPNLNFTNNGTGLVDGVSGTFIWQAQLEAGVNSSSPIYTTAATVTRLADDVSLGSASSLIGQTEGTVYFELELTNRSPKNVFEITDGTNNNIFQIQCSATNIIFYTTKGGVLATPINVALPALGIAKIALRYKSGDYALYANGSSIGTSSSTTIFPNGPLTTFIISNATYSHLNDGYRAFALFPTGLPNAQLASLTTL